MVQETFRAVDFCQFYHYTLLKFKLIKNKKEQQGNIVTTMSRRCFFKISLLFHKWGLTVSKPGSSIGPELSTDMAGQYFYS
jgi:hypothetical protein